LKEDMSALRAIRAAEAVPAALPPAFEALFRKEYARVVAIAQRIVRDADEAEDVAQDVFISFYRKHPADAGYAPAWLHAASAHTALNAIRSRERRGRRDTLHAVERDVVVDPASAAERIETRDEVRAALARLDERAASLLALRYSGLSYEEIAAAMGLRKSSIGTLLSRAAEAFRKEMVAR
jgi:RNA polymerase sigma factor (sigma-70 family)